MMRVCVFCVRYLRTPSYSLFEPCQTVRLRRTVPITLARHREPKCSSGAGGRWEGVSREAETRLTFQQLQALASPSRYKILKILTQRRGTVSEVATAAMMAKSTVHGHLQLLEKVGLVRRFDDEERLWIYYDLTPLGRNVALANPLRLVVIFGSSLVLSVVGIIALVWKQFFAPQEITWGVPPIGVPPDSDAFETYVGPLGVIAVGLGVLLGLVAWRLTRRALKEPR